MSPISVLHKREAIVESSVFRAQVEEVFEESSNVSGGVKVVQRVPFVVTSKRNLCERESIKGFRTEVVASVTLPSLGGSHSLTTNRTSASVQARFLFEDLPEDVVGSGVVEQIEALFFAIVKLHRPIR